MKITREQLIKMIKEELGDPAGEAEAERQRRARTAWKRRFTSVEEVDAIADLMENDPEFEMLSRFAEEFRRRSQRGTPPQDVLEIVLPESVPGGLIAKVILKARERLPADETPIKKPKSPALSGAEMDRIAPSLEETKGNKMKITKKQLKEIIEEELKKALNEDVIDYIEDGDTILQPVGNILLKQDGRVIFTAKDRDGKELGDVLAQADEPTVKRLRGGGTLKEPERQMDPFGKEVLDTVLKIKQEYGDNVPPAIIEMEKEAKKAANAEGLKDSPLNKNITDYWNNVLRWHQKDGSRLQHKVTTTFNQLNTLLQKVR
jgi:hypothetical protein